VKTLGLSFASAKDLRNRAEALPTGPPWMCKLIETVYPTKHKIYLYYRDAVECLRSLMRNPLLKDYIEFTPRRLYKSAEKLARVYTEWLSGDAAWLMQVTFILMTPKFNHSLFSLHDRKNYQLALLYWVLFYLLTKPTYPQ
jgi:hypothetical protein